MIRTDILNHLAHNLNYESYLEIGLGNGDNFRSVRCKYKIGVDPLGETNPTFRMESNQYWSTVADHQTKFDLIFIDGLHTHSQVMIDVYHALDRINHRGTIVVHDCNPFSYESQLVPRQVDNWNGDVWTAWCKLRYMYGDQKLYVVDTDEGCGVIEFDNLFKYKNVEDFVPPTWDEFNENRVMQLNLISEDKFIELTNYRSKL